MGALELPSVQSEDLPDGFKMTELGPLPAEWQVVRLGELSAAGVLLIRNGFPQGEHNLSGQGIPHLRPFNITSDGHMDLEQVKFIHPPADESPYWLQRGDVIFNNTNSEELVGKTAYFALDGRYVLSNHMTCIRILQTNVVDGYWLAKYLHYLWTQDVFRGLCRRHVNQASVSLERLKGLELPLPPLPEQRAIAHVLRTVQEAKEASERVIAALKEVKKSLMRHLFTYGPVPLDRTGQVELQETELGPVPAHWRVVRLGEVANVKYGKANPKSFEGDIPVIGSGGIFAWTNKALVNSPTIVVGRKGTAGEVHLAEQPSYPSDTTFFLVWKTEISVRCIFYYLSLHKISGSHAKTTLPSIQRHDLENLPIPLPPLAEQQEIARMLQVVDEKIAAEEKRRAALAALFKSLLAQLMSGRVRVRFTAENAKNAEETCGQ